jgi:hypothetical protein
MSAERNLLPSHSRGVGNWPFTAAYIHVRLMDVKIVGAEVSQRARLTAPEPHILELQHHAHVALQSCPNLGACSH